MEAPSYYYYNYVSVIYHGACSNSVTWWRKKRDLFALSLSLDHVLLPRKISQFINIFYDVPKLTSNTKMLSLRASDSDASHCMCYLSHSLTTHHNQHLLR